MGNTPKEPEIDLEAETDESAEDETSAEAEADPTENAVQAASVVKKPRRRAPRRKTTLDSMVVAAASAEPEPAVAAPSPVSTPRRRPSRAAAAEVPTVAANPLAIKDLEKQWDSIKTVSQNMSASLEKAALVLEKIQAQQVEAQKPPLVALPTIKPASGLRLAVGMSVLAFVLSFVSLILSQSVRETTLSPAPVALSRPQTFQNPPATHDLALSPGRARMAPALPRRNSPETKYWRDTRRVR